MGHCYTRVFLHIVWTTKKRVPYIASGIKRNLYGFISRLVDEEGVELIAIGGICEHVHMLVRIRSTCSIAHFVGAIKYKSSRFMNRKGGDSPYFAWQEGYSAFSVSPSKVDRTAKYILRQEEHHSNLDFDEEIKFLFNL